MSLWISEASILAVFISLITGTAGNLWDTIIGGRGTPFGYER